MLTDEDVIVGASTVFPVTKEIMRDFLAGEFNEKELFDVLDVVLRKDEMVKLDCLYLTSAFVSPDFRGKGYGAKLLKHHIELLDPEKKCTLFGWEVSQEGEALVAKVSRELGREVLVK